ncbi:hypothetical protein BD289DRAFT_48055 [Coniella lustricola]|uniref:Uncharacterized protein n=1 Tax=Coniella lustricola TaxID=2025994 RepID=A0A2T3AIG9_9PEZI|nr:hypothetical protein BD289DRAFT_48055 [Coniella lustricola]
MAIAPSRDMNWSAAARIQLHSRSGKYNKYSVRVLFTAPFTITSVCRFGAKKVSRVPAAYSAGPQQTQGQHHHESKVHWYRRTRRLRSYSRAIREPGHIPECDSRDGYPVAQFCRLAFPFRLHLHGWLVIWTSFWRLNGTHWIILLNVHAMAKNHKRSRSAWSRLWILGCWHRDMCAAGGPM